MMKNIINIFRLFKILKNKKILVLGSSPISKGLDYSDYDIVTVNGAIGLANKQPFVSMITDALLIDNNKNNETTINQFKDRSCEVLMLVNSSNERSDKLLAALSNLNFLYDKIIFVPRFYRSIFFVYLIGIKGLLPGSNKISNGVFIYAALKLINGKTIYDRITPGIDGHAYGGNFSPRAHSNPDEKVINWLKKRK